VEIRAVVTHHLKWVRDNANWARYLLALREADFLHPAEDTLREMNETYTEEFAAWLKPHVDRGSIVRLPPDLYRPILVGPLHEFSRQWLTARGKSTMAEAQSVLADAVWRALRG